MERVNTERRLRTVIRDSILDPPGTIAGYQLNAFPLRRRQFLEEAFKHLLTEAFGRPDHSIRIVVDDDSNVLVTLLVFRFSFRTSLSAPSGYLMFSVFCALDAVVHSAGKDQAKRNGPADPAEVQVSVHGLPASRFFFRNSM